MLFIAVLYSSILFLEFDTPLSLLGFSSIPLPLNLQETLLNFEGSLETTATQHKDFMEAYFCFDNRRLFSSGEVKIDAERKVLPIAPIFFNSSAFCCCCWYFPLNFVWKNIYQRCLTRLPFGFIRIVSEAHKSPGPKVKPTRAHGP